MNTHIWDVFATFTTHRRYWCHHICFVFLVRLTSYLNLHSVSWPAGSDSTGDQKEPDCMWAYEKTSQILTWFLSSVVSFLIIYGLSRWFEGFLNTTWCAFCQTLHLLDCCVNQNARSSPCKECSQTLWSQQQLSDNLYKSISVIHAAGGLSDSALPAFYRSLRRIRQSVGNVCHFCSPLLFTVSPRQQGISEKFPSARSGTHLCSVIMDNKELIFTLFMLYLSCT